MQQEEDIIFAKICKYAFCTNFSIITYFEGRNYYATGNNKEKIILQKQLLMV